MELPEMRTGRTLGRTLYLRTGGDDWKADTCVGIVDTPELAEAIVAAVNADVRLREALRPRDGETTPGVGC
jgi:hypothetical protein